MMTLKNKLTILAGLSFALCGTLTALSEDWSQFMGPNRDGVVTDNKATIGWTKGTPKEEWSISMGPGFGGASIVGDEVFVLDRERNKADILRVLNLKDGKEKWTFSYQAEGTPSSGHPGSRSVPTVTKKYIYTVGCMGDVHCVSRETKKPVWHFNIDKKYGDAQHNWGFSQSPLIDGDNLIVAPLSPNSPGLVAVNRQTGKDVWRSENFGGDNYTSPMKRKIAGAEGILMVSNKQVSFVNPQNGKMLWKYNGWSCRWNIPSPTVMPDGERLFVTGGYDAGSVMIKVKKKGSGFDVSEVFRLKEGSQLHPALYHKKFLYVNINENSKLRKTKRSTGGLACVDPEKGKIVWRTGQSPFFERGALLLVGDKILIVDGEKGTLHLAKANPEKYEEIVSAKVLEGQGKKIWAPIAWSQGKIVIRDQKTLKCFDLENSK